MAARLTTPDIVAIVAYFMVVLAIGFWATCTAKRGNTKGYFLAGRQANWFLVGASTFATNIGASSFIGLAGSAAASGIAIVMFEWHAMIMLIALGWVFMPVYRACGCYTMPQYLKMRFGGNRLRVLLAVIRILSGITSTIAGQMYAGALFITTLLGWDLYLSVVTILAVTAVFTIIGGLKAVLWTDAIQAVILVGGSATLSALALLRVGGWEGIQMQFPLAAANYTYLDVSLHGNHTCGFPRSDAFHIFRSATADYPWPGMIGGLTLLAITGWCTDQIVVQRSLSARSEADVKGGLIFTAYLKILSFAFFVLPGMASRILFPQEVACADPQKCVAHCGNAAGCTNIAYPLLVLHVLPNGARGLMMAALLAALMSSLTSIFNSSAAIFTMDVYRRIRRHASQRELMVVGRVYTLLLVCVSVAWIPMLQSAQGATFWNYVQSVLSTLVPPTVTVFLTGIFWKRTTEAGAFAGMAIGLIIGLTRLGLSLARSAPPCGGTGENTTLPIVTRVHYLHFAMINSAICVFIIACVSLITKPRPPEKLQRVTFWTKDDPLAQEVSDSEDEESEMQHRSGDKAAADNQQAKRSPIRSFLERVICGIEDLPQEDQEKGNERRDKEGIQQSKGRDRMGQRMGLKQMNQSKGRDGMDQRLGREKMDQSSSLAAFLNANAVIALAVCVFMHGFFA